MMAPFVKDSRSDRTKGQFLSSKKRRNMEMRDSTLIMKLKAWIYMKKLVHKALEVLRASALGL